MSEAHWDAHFTDREPDELPWHEPTPSTLSIVTANSTVDDPVIDAGGGASLLTAELADLGYKDLTVLDVSAAALDRSRERLGPRSEAICWIRGDVTEFVPSRQWQLWHDRAVFHFLVEEEQRRSYRTVAASAVALGGVLIVATFAPEGPEWCAGLQVRRYDCESLAAEFAPEFELVECRTLAPASAGGDQRPYVAVVLRRVSLIQ